jgi:hypothetical protein
MESGADGPSFRQILGSEDVHEIPKLRSEGARIFAGFPESEIVARFKGFGRRVFDGPPEIRSVEDVHFEPLEPLGQWKFRGGVFRRGEFLPELGLRRGGPAAETQHVVAVAETRNPECKLDTAWFGGILFGHFGHFLLETLARLETWDVIRSPEPIVFFNPWKFSRLHPFMEGAFGHLGISLERIRLCNAPLEIRSLKVQAPAFQANGFLHVSARSILKKRAHTVPRKGTTVYLARTRASVLRRVLAEEEFQRRLDNSGLASIVYPESLSFTKQLASLQMSAVVAGCEGSAFHSLMFAIGARTSVMFCANLPPLNFFLCDEMIDGNAIYIRCGRSNSEDVGRVSRRTDWLLDVDRAMDIMGRISVAE